ncbi:MAG: hypothetical protein R6X34_29215 [Chloroflexota bacterium]
MRGIKRRVWNPFLAVFGDSGSGKSSVLRAGVIPTFRRGQIASKQGTAPPNRSTSPFLATNR